MTDPRRLPELWTPPELPAAPVEVLPRLEIEIRPQHPQSSTWRVYAIRDRNNRMLRSGGFVLGGSMREAHQAALALQESHGFVYKAPPGTGLPE
jgi:hypothetical protein